MSTLRTFSYGGGVQSTAALVLAAQRIIDFPVFLFSNVGDDSEDPATLEYVEKYAKPYAALNGIQLHELHRTRRDGTPETLYGRLTKEGSRSLPIPVRMSNGAPGTRSCTADFKIRVIGKWLKAHGASEENKAVVGVGISLDEIDRVNNRRAMPYEIPTYPLLDHAPPLAAVGLRADHPAGRAADPTKVSVLVLPVPPPVHVGGNAPRPARPVSPVLRVGRHVERAAGDVGQGPGVPDPVQQAAGGCDPRGAGHVAGV